MKVLKSHRDERILPWIKDDFMRYGAPSPVAKFEYVSIKSMQRGDGIQESEAYFEHLGALRESISKQGMISPIILVAIHHKYWAEFVPNTSKNFWIHIPYVIQTGNNRYRIALENGYTHISSIVFGTRVDPRAWNYLREELKKPLSQHITVGKQFEQSMLGNILLEGESLTVV